MKTDQERLKELESEIAKLREVIKQLKALIEFLENKKK